MFHIGYAYYNGGWGMTKTNWFDVNKSEEVALYKKLAESNALFKNLAESGNSSGMYYLFLFKKLAESGDNSGMAYYSLLLKNYDADLEMNHLADLVLSDIWAQKALSSNANANNSFVFGLCYYFGLGTPTDAEKAFKYFEISANEGNEYGQHFLAYCFYYGNGTKGVYEKACYWFLKSAEQGNALSQYMIGFMYRYGYGCEQNEKESKLWFKKSAKQNYKKIYV